MQYTRLLLFTFTMAEGRTQRCTTMWRNSPWVATHFNLRQCKLSLTWFCFVSFVCFHSIIVQFAGVNNLLCSPLILVIVIRALCFSPVQPIQHWAQRTLNGIQTFKGTNVCASDDNFFAKFITHFVPKPTWRCNKKRRWKLCATSIKAKCYFFEWPSHGLGLSFKLDWRFNEQKFCWKWDVQHDDTFGMREWIRVHRTDGDGNEWAI